MTILRYILVVIFQKVLHFLLYFIGPQFAPLSLPAKLSPIHINFSSYFSTICGQNLKGDCLPAPCFFKTDFKSVSQWQIEFLTVRLS